jgi:hypothetical protein
LLLAFVVSSCGDKNLSIAATNQKDVERVSTPALSTTPSPAPVKTPDRSNYQSETDSFFGLYYLLNKNNSNERKLIISEDDRPIPQKANDPEEATVPGFYLSHDKRLDFKEIEIIGKNIYFKTRDSDGSYFEFWGIFDEEIDSDFSEPIPFLKGNLRHFENSKLVEDKNVRFGHAVIY